MNSFDNLSQNNQAYRLFFGTLANQSRLVILNVLRGSSKNVTQICQETSFEQSMVSHNLRTLEYHGMVFKEKKGKFSYYCLNKNTIKPLLELIEAHMREYCCKIAMGER